MQDTSTTQAPAEQSQQAVAAPPNSAPERSSSERPALASLHEAFAKAAAEAAPAASNGETPPPSRRDRSRDTNHTADSQATKGASRQPGPDPEHDQSPAGDHADTATGDAPTATDGAAAPGAAEATARSERPSRRGQADIDRLTKERDELTAQLQQFRTLTHVPDQVIAAMQQHLLPQAEFDRLDAKKRREDLTRDYLTPDEADRYTVALQVREWFGPMLQHARSEAADWANGLRQQVMDDQARELGPFLQETEYVAPESISRAGSWSDIYRTIRDQSYTAGKEDASDALQPKLDDANARIAELESELSSLRVRGGYRGPRLERGGTSGGAYSAMPDYATASARDLFNAAAQRDQQRRDRRTSNGAR